MCSFFQVRNSSFFLLPGLERRHFLKAGWPFVERDIALKREVTLILCSVVSTIQTNVLTYSDQYYDALYL